MFDNNFLGELLKKLSSKLGQKKRKLFGPKVHKTRYEPSLQDITSSFYIKGK